jgi:uncharacterized membrane protein
MGIGRKIYWIPLVIMGMMAVLAPCSILAQAEGKDADLEITVISDTYRKNLTPGQEETIYMEVSNTGIEKLTDIQLSADLPEGWTAEFRPELIDSLSPGGLAAVDMVLRPGDKATRGEYTINIIAQSGEARRVASLFVRVETGYSFWLLIGIVIGVFLIIGFVGIFMALNR